MRGARSPPSTTVHTRTKQKNTARAAGQETNVHRERSCLRLRRRSSPTVRSMPTAHQQIVEKHCASSNGIYDAPPSQYPKANTTTAYEKCNALHVLCVPYTPTLHNMYIYRDIYTTVYSPEYLVYNIKWQTKKIVPTLVDRRCLEKYGGGLRAYCRLSPVRRKIVPGQGLHLHRERFRHRSLEDKSCYRLRTGSINNQKRGRRQERG